MSKKLVLFLTILILVFPRFLGSVEPTFGPEWTITNNSLILSEGTAKIHREFLERLKFKIDIPPKFIGDNNIKITFDEYDAFEPRVKFKSADFEFWFVPSADPGVLEFQAKPLTLEEWKRPVIKDIVEEFIFKIGRSMDLKPNAIVGGGHIHVGYESGFIDNPLLFRNFLVDLFNHSELADGVLGRDTHNAQPVSELPAQLKRNLYQEIRGLDRELLQEKPMDIKKLSQNILRRVYIYHPEKWEPVNKYQAINLDKFLNRSGIEQTVELRFFGPQESFDAYLKQLDLLSARLNWLEKNSNEKKYLKLEIPKPQGIKTDIQKLNRFYTYVQEMGKTWDEFKNLVILQDKPPKKGSLVLQGPAVWNTSIDWCQHLGVDVAASLIK